MYKRYPICLFAMAIALTVAGVAGARAAPQAAPAPVIDLREATGQTHAGEWYCVKMQQRCDRGDANACAMVAKNCGND